MPNVRGRFIPEREKTRSVKRSFDVLLWIELLDRHDVRHLESLEQLRIYLHVQYRGVCAIRLLIPDGFTATQEALQRDRIPFEVVTSPETDEPFLREHANLNHPAISGAAVCARACSADCIVVSKGAHALRFVEELSTSIQCLVTDASFLLCITEIFARGFEIPWTYRMMMWKGTWDTFYLHADPHVFEPLISLIGTLQRAGSSAEAVETARSIAFNRMPQVCYTRDKLLWLSLQRDAARRDGFTNQSYLFEISYHLNSYYLHMSGTFDQLALLVNGACALGLPEKQIGATYKQFLGALKPKSTRLYALFTSTEITDFIARLGALRNLAAHRGSIMPRKVVERPDRQPTTEEIDQHLEKTDRGWVLTEPFHSMSPQFVAVARSNAAAEILEQNTVAEDVEFVEYNGKRGFISPLMDTTWNFAKVRDFALAVARECSACLA